MYAGSKVATYILFIFKHFYSGSKFPKDQEVTVYDKVVHDENYFSRG